MPPCKAKKKPSFPSYAKQSKNTEKFKAFAGSDQNKENKISWLAFILESLRITLSGQVNPLLRPSFFMAIGADIESSQVQSWWLKFNKNVAASDLKAT